MKNNINKIVIVGGGTAGWMSAAALAKLLNKEIVLIESEQIGTVGVGEATVPHLKFFNHKLGISEDEFMHHCHATYKLGIEFANWHQDGSDYIHPFAELGEPLFGVPFHQLWLQYKSHNPDSKISDFSLAIQACYDNKFAFPSNDQSSVFSTYSYAYHIDASKYAQFLARFSKQLGVTRIEGKVQHVAQDELSNISSVTLENGQTINGDLFIDCTGFRSLLLGKTLGVGYQDWSEYLPCDSAIAATSKVSDEFKPYTRSTAKEAGWQWQIPLTHKTGNGYVYSSRFLSQEQALESFKKDVAGELTSEPKHLRFKAGKRDVMWQKNCIAIGLSSGFLEPLESTSIYLIQSAIMKLVELFPANTDMALHSDEFNRYMDNDIIKIRDFLILHYCTTAKTDSPFWKYCSEMQLPDSLAEKIALYKESGHIVTYEQGMFHEPSWIAVYLGQGVTPKQIDPRAKALFEQGKLANLGKLATMVKQACDSLPSHKQALMDIQNRCHTAQRSPNTVIPSMSLYGRPS